MCFVRSDDLLSKPVYSGLGEEIGVVIGVEPYPSGFAHKLWVMERPALGEPVMRVVDERFVREVTPERIQLKGPREGFHITRVNGASGEEVVPVAPLLAPDPE